MPHEPLHMYIDPDGVPRSNANVIPSNATLDAVSLAAGAAAVGTAAVGGADTVAFIAPLLLTAGQPGGYGMAAASTVGSLLPPEVVMPLFIGLGGLSVVLGTINLVWGYRKALACRTIRDSLLTDPEFQRVVSDHEMKHFGHARYFSGAGGQAGQASPSPTGAHEEAPSAGAAATGS